MTVEPIYTFGEAARVLGISPDAVAPIAVGLEITHKPVPHNGKAKGLDRSDMAKMRRFLKREETAA